MKLTLETHGQLIEEALKQGRSYRDIAREIGCGKDTVNEWVRKYLPHLIRKPASTDVVPMRILAIDIETMANLCWSFEVRNAFINPNQIVRPARMICFAAKWVGADEMLFYSEHHDGREAMLKAAWGLLHEADAVLHYNGKRFDTKHINRELWTAEHRPYSPIKQIDLLATVRKRFKFPTAKLEHVSVEAGLEGKIKHEGWRLWDSCDDTFSPADTKAWERMRAYNERDVEQLEELYQRLLPWIDDHPSYGAFSGEDVCQNCGSDLLKQDKYWVSSTGKYKQYLCGNCNAYNRDTHRTYSTRITGAR